MWKFVHDQSFVARIESLTDGFGGYFDCGDLALRPDDEDHLVPQRRPVDWLTLSSVRRTHPHQFWFRCHEHVDTGERRFDLRSWSRISGRDMFRDHCHCDLTHNGYVGLYTTPVALSRLWQVVRPDGTPVWGAGDQVQLGRLGPVAILTYDGDALCGYGRREVGDRWFAYAASSGGPRLSLALEISDLGEEELEMN